MNFIDRCKDVTTTTGAGPITLAGTPPTGFQTLPSLIAWPVGTMFVYGVAGGSEWESGVGTITALSTFSRAPTASSNGGALVNFSAGSKDFFVTVDATTIASLTAAATSQQAGERNPGSTTNGYIVIRQETNGTIVTGVTSAVAVSGGQPAHLARCVIAGSALVGTCTITGLTDQLGNPTSVVIPAGTAAFTVIDFGMVRCESNLQITLTSAADKVLVNWRPI